jgi:hypothetical protein
VPVRWSRSVFSSKVFVSSARLSPRSRLLVRSRALWFVPHLRCSGPAGPRGQVPLPLPARERFAPPAIFFDLGFVAAGCDADFVLAFFDSGAEAAGVFLPCIFARVFLPVGVPSHGPASVRQLLFPVHR